MQRKIPQLDGVRGVAILVVLAHNLHGFYFFPLSYLTAYGWMGVDLFFVLSGFLITGILLDTKSAPEYFRNFYVRRCLRIWPLYYSVLVLMFIVIPHVRPQDAAEIFSRSHPGWSYPFYLQNFFVGEPASAPGPCRRTLRNSLVDVFLRGHCICGVRVSCAIFCLELGKSCSDQPGPHVQWNNQLRTVLASQASRRRSEIHGIWSHASNGGILDCPARFLSPCQCLLVLAGKAHTPAETLL